MNHIQTVSELIEAHIDQSDAQRASAYLYAQVQALQSVGCNIGLQSVLMALVNQLDGMVEQDSPEVNLGYVNSILVRNYK